MEQLGSAEREGVIHRREPWQICDGDSRSRKGSGRSHGCSTGSEGSRQAGAPGLIPPITQLSVPHSQSKPGAWSRESYRGAQALSARGSTGLAARLESSSSQRLDLPPRPVGTRDGAEREQVTGRWRGRGRGGGRWGRCAEARREGLGAGPT